MINKIKLVIAIIMVFSSLTYAKEYGFEGEFFKGLVPKHFGVDGKDYEGEPGEHYIWVKLDKVYLNGGRQLDARPFSSYDEAIKYANSNPEITHFFYAHDEVWINKGEGYATDSELLHYKGHAVFYSGSDTAWYPSHSADGYIRQSIVRRPHNYSQYYLANYIKNHPEILSPNSTYLEVVTSLDEAFKLAENDPTITHFAVMEKDTFFDVKRSDGTIDWSKKPLSKKVILFFQGSLPSWMNTNYYGGAWLYSKKNN